MHNCALDFGRIGISTVKGALGSMHWNVDVIPFTAPGVVLTS
jgi:hypothetical protein